MSSRLPEGPFDVAVIGYGPVGVVLAGLLGQAGLKVFACDRLPDVYEIPRAIALDHEILRIFQQLGAVDAILPHCEAFTPSEFFGVDGQLIRRMTMLAPPHPQGFTPSMVFSQPPVERALRARVAQLPSVTTALGVEFQSLAQDADGVTLTVTAADGTQQPIRAAHVVACDGGSSRTRGQLGIEMEDLDFDEPWLVVDVMVHEHSLHKLPKTSVQYCEPDRPCTLVIGPGRHRRWEISLKAGEDPQAAATPERTWQHLARWLTPEDGRLWRQASYRFHALVAQRWRQARVFLAGDAAHMQPPFLGQGMCQGIRDAASLAWRLIEVARARVGGAAAQALLDTYGAERKAHVRELTQRIKGVGAVVCERDVQRARERDARLLEQCGGVVRDTPRQDILPRLETGWLATEDHPARGTLFPQPWVLTPQGDRRLDDVSGGGWRLFLDRAVANAWLPDAWVSNGWPSDDNPLGSAHRPAAIRCLVVGNTPDLQTFTERDGVLAHWWQRMGASAALVRPDNYVFAAAASVVELRAVLSEWHRLRLGSSAACPTTIGASP